MCDSLELKNMGDEASHVGRLGTYFNILSYFPSSKIFYLVAFSYSSTFLFREKSTYLLVSN